MIAQIECSVSRLGVTNDVRDGLLCDAKYFVLERRSECSIGATDADGGFQLAG